MSSKTSSPVRFLSLQDRVIWESFEGNREIDLTKVKEISV